MSESTKVEKAFVLKKFELSGCEAEEKILFLFISTFESQKKTAAPQPF